MVETIEAYAGSISNSCQHPAGGLLYDPTYLGIQRTENIVDGTDHPINRTKAAAKRKLFKRMAEILAENPGLRPRDLMVSLVEVAWENWSFGGEGERNIPFS